MAVIDYDKWMKDTARFGLTRSPELKAIDAAFLTYEKLGTGAAKSALEKAFNAWKAKQGAGDAWKKSSRNSNRSAEKLAALLSGAGDEDGGFSQGKAPDFMHEDLINARLGVLYLFSRLSVTPGLFKMLLEGGLDLAAQGMDLGGASDKAQDMFGKASKVANPIGAKLGDMLEDKLIKSVQPKNMYSAQGVAPSIDLVPKPVTVTSTQVLQNAQGQNSGPKNPKLEALKEKVRGWFDTLVAKLLEMLKAKFGTVEGIAGTIKQIVRGCVEHFAAKAAPFVGGALDVAAGLGKTVDAAVTRFRTWKEGRDVELGDGHPTVIVDAITRAMNLSIFEGLWTTLKGAGALAMDGVGFGAGGLVNVIISAGELLIKFVWKLVETVCFNKFCGEARGHWDNHLSADGLHRRPFAFSEWYGKTAIHIPLIAVLTLNTGICGDKMRYLTMFNSGGNQITTEQFQAGVRFLDNLKPWGAKYIGDQGFNIRSAGDVLVDRLVNTFATSHEREKTAFDQIIAVVTA